MKKQHTILVTITATFANERRLDDEVHRLNDYLQRWQKTGNYLVGIEDIQFKITGQ